MDIYAILNDDSYRSIDEIIKQKQREWDEREAKKKNNVQSQNQKALPKQKIIKIQELRKQPQPKNSPEFEKELENFRAKMKAHEEDNGIVSSPTTNRSRDFDSDSFDEEIRKSRKKKPSKYNTTVVTSYGRVRSKYSGTFCEIRGLGCISF